MADFENLNLFGLGGFFGIIINIMVGYIFLTGDVVGQHSLHDLNVEVFIVFQRIKLVKLF